MRCESSICEELRRRIGELEERVDVLTKGIVVVRQLMDGLDSAIALDDAFEMVAKYEPLPKPPAHKPHPKPHAK